MKKKIYQKPTSYILQMPVMKLMAGSGGTGGGGDAGARGFSPSWDDEE